MAKKEDTGMNPAGLFENAVVAFTPGGIETQEVQGQKKLVNSDTIPVKCSGCEYADIEKMGIKFLEDPIEAKKNGELFVKVELPPGWKKVPTDHSLYSNLIDEKGRTRACIFYKAAFYDRDAHINLERRFNYEVFPEDFYKSKLSYEERNELKWAGVVQDGNEEVIFHTKWEPAEDHLDLTTKKERMGKEALAWLNKHYPDWENYAAYWD